MKLVKNMVAMIGLITVVMYAKQMTRVSRSQGVPAAPEEWVQPSFAKASEDRPDINALPIPMNATPEEYARHKVAAMSQQLVKDIFPSADTIEHIVFEFRDEYPGSFKETDVKILYNAIINDPEVRKSLTLKNTTSVYNFIKEALSKAWDKKGE